MPLLDNFMLPKRVREMAQMADLLQAEQLMLDRLYVIIRELFAQGSINNNTTLTKAELERICSLITGCECRVDEFSQKLTVHICVKRNSGRPLSIRALIDGVKVLIPAHLKYVIVPELQTDVNVNIERLGRKIHYVFCGKRYSGEQPNRAWQGLINLDNLQISAVGLGWIFKPPTPEGMAGGSGQAQIEIEARPLAFNFQPKTAKGMGGGQNGAHLPQVAAEAYVFAENYCGERYTGEEDLDNVDG